MLPRGGVTFPQKRKKLERVDGNNGLSGACNCYPAEEAGVKWTSKQTGGAIVGVEIGKGGGADMH